MAAIKNGIVSPDLRVGFIGAGNMARAIGGGLIQSGLVKASNIIASDPYPLMLEIIGKQGVKGTTSNVEVVQNSDVIFLAVKPHMVEPVLKEIAPIVTENHLVISIASGIMLKALEEMLPSKTRVVRVMPNTPALVREGASVFVLGSSTKAGDNDLVAALMGSVGICEEDIEAHIDAVTGLSGSGPAYVFAAIEALADGGVKMGLPRGLAQKLAAQTLIGGAKMVLETGQHPGALKDGVCCAGGTTIAAMHELEKGGFRASLISAVEASAKRAKELGGN